MVNLLDDAHSLLGEGPVWVAAEGCLYWVDIKGQSLHAYHPHNEMVRRWVFPGQLAWILPRRSGGFVAGSGHHIGFLSVGEVLHFEPFLKIEPDLEENRLNDAKVDIDGSILFGTMDDAESAATGALYRLLPSLEIQKLDEGYVVSNGPAIDPIAGKIYHTDSAARRIYSFERENGQLVNKKLFIQFQDDQGFPDGMTVDHEGALWVAHWGGGRVSRFLPDGSLAESLVVPAAQVTSCCFGGEALDELYITTAAIHLSPAMRAQQPHAGGLFVARVDVAGRASMAFAG